MNNNNYKQVLYINPTPLSEPSNLTDQGSRTVSGRILVLPQPSFALAAIVKQILDVAGTGSHLKPNVRVQGQATRALAEAIDIGKDIGLQPGVMEEIINIMGSETAKTPFGTLINFEGARFQPFKGVQHRQLVLTELVVVDRFGQAVARPMPSRKPVTPPNYPQVSNTPLLSRPVVSNYVT
ncbi:hypothetical protein F5884DRAFT_754748 [Xylogone sp. PMI_703]|nr:hypothetical protein F5884DRAFT_754748 [Xylogone sp. PMI_703]